MIYLILKRENLNSLATGSKLLCFTLAGNMIRADTQDSQQKRVSKLRRTFSTQLSVSNIDCHQRSEGIELISCSPVNMWYISLFFMAAKAKDEKYPIFDDTGKEQRKMGFRTSDTWYRR